MKNNFNNIQTLIIVVLVAVIIWLSKCDGSFVPTGKTDTVSVEVIKWDTFTYMDTVYKPKWKKYTVTIHDTIHDSISLPIGTVLTQTNDSLVVKNDSTDIIVKYSLLSENPLIKLSKSIDYKVRRKEIKTIITEEVVKKHSLFLGPDVILGGGNGALLLNTSYEHKGKNQYNLGVGFNLKLQPMIKLGMSWQILK